MNAPETPRESIFPGDVLTAVTGEEATELARLAAGKDVLELGAYHGFSTVVLASVANRVYSVDWHMGDDHAGLGDSWEVFNATLTRYGVTDRVTVCHGRFEDEVPRLAAAGVQVDGAFIDGMHDETSARRDLGLVLPLVRPGGFIAFHDYGRGPDNGFPGFGVTAVANQFGVNHAVGFLGVCFVPAI
jgi:predicted O-methyltransferase YrrM